MKTHLLFVPFTVVFLTTLWCSTEANTRSERSIREWFSSFMKRFQRKESRQEPFYLRPADPAYFHSSYVPDESGTFYEPYQQSPFTHQNSIGGNGAGNFGGHSSFVKSREPEYRNQLPRHVTTKTEVKHSGSSGSPVYHNIKSNSNERSPQGFGPLKNSDIIDYARESDISSNAPVASAQVSADIYPSETDFYEASSESHKDTHTAVVQGIDEDLSYEPPSNSIIQATPIKFSSSHSRLQNKEGNVALETLGVESSNLIPTSPSYQISSSASNLYPSKRTAYAPPSSPIDSRLFVSGKAGQSYFAPQLGPDDPIIEIVFQDGEPLPPPPPPVIDESLYAPASDDVEVYFIEYSPDDNLEDLKNLDLSGAQPAILQNLPNELPPELREHLISSGVLENAEIEILDLDRALTDQSLDVGTRNALRQAYSRTNRQAPTNTIVDTHVKKQPVDIRVKRLSHDASTPEGIVEFLSGLQSYRKGTFAGVVDVNDKNSDKYLPVEIDGRSLPVPDNIPLDKKKVEGVLVFSDAEQKAQSRRPKSTFTRNTPATAIAAASTSVAATATASQPEVQPNAKRMLNIQWADMESNGWIPIVNS